MDALFKDAVDALVNEGQRRNASENLTHPNENIEPPIAEADAAQQAIDAGGHGELPAVQQDLPEDFSMWSDLGDQFKSAMGALNSPTEAQLAADKAKEGKPLSEIDPVGTAIVTGAGKAIAETKDFMDDVRGVEHGPKSDLRVAMEAESDNARAQNPVAAVVGPAAQFVAGLWGAGKLLEPIKVGSKVMKLGKEVLKGATAGAIVMDPHEERLSNFVQQFPSLENDVTGYLAADPEDTAWEGRMKNALEGAGMDVALAGAFMISLKALKLARMGDPEAAKALAQQLDDGQSMEQILKEADEMGSVQTVPGDTGVRVGEKPRVRVQAGKLLDGQEPFPVVEKPKVRVKAGSQPDIQDLTSGQIKPQEPTISQTGDVFEAPPAKIKESITPEDAERIVRGTEFDLEVLAQANRDPEAARTMSEGFKDQDPTVPWQKIQSDDDLNILISNTMDVLGNGRKVVSDTQVKNRVQAMAKYWDRDPNAVYADILKGGTEANKSVQRMEGAYLLANRAFMDSYKVINDIKLQRFDDYGGSREGAVTEARRRLNIAFKLYTAGRDMTASAGRNLRRMRPEFKVDQKTLDAVKGLDDEQFMRLLETTGGDPAKLKDMARPGLLKIIQDEALFSMRNGLLWFYPTHIVNLTTNTFMQAARPMEKLLGGAVMAAFGKGEGIMGRAVKEYWYTTTSIMDGFKAAGEAFLKGDSKLAPHATDWLDSQGSLTTAHPDIEGAYVPVKDFSSVFHNARVAYLMAAGLPTRALGAQDEFFKTLAYRASVQARAATDATGKGLKGKDLVDYVETRLKEAFDADGRALDTEAIYEAQVRTFNQELLPGTFGFGLRNFRASVPAMGFVLPFLKTPINVLRYAHKYTPLLNLGQKEYRQMLMGVQGSERQAQAIGQMMMGTMAVSAAGWMAANQMITGRGPTDPKAKAQLMATGWKPYSVMVKRADGSVTYFPYGRFDPVGMSMGMTADLYEWYNADPDSDAGSATYLKAGTAITMALAKNFSEKTFLLNLNNAIDAISSGDEEDVAKWLGNTARSIVPASSAMRGYANQDPYMREARTFLDRMLQDVPGYSETIPVKRHDIFGTPLTKNLGLMSNTKWDEVQGEINRITLETGKIVGPPNPVRGDVDLRDVPSKEDPQVSTYARLQELVGELKNPNRGGLDLHDALQAEMRKDDYGLLADGDEGTKGTKLNVLSGIIQEYRDAAWKAILLKDPALGLQVRRSELEAISTIEQNEGKTNGPATQLLRTIPGVN